LEERLEEHPERRAQPSQATMARQPDWNPCSDTVRRRVGGGDRGGGGPAPYRRSVRDFTSHRPASMPTLCGRFERMCFDDELAWEPERMPILPSWLESTLIALTILAVGLCAAGLTPSPSRAAHDEAAALTRSAANPAEPDTLSSLASPLR